MGTCRNITVENTQVGVMIQGFERCGEVVFKDSRVGWLLLSCIDTLQWDDEKLRVTNKQQILSVRVREPHWYLMKRPLSPAVER